MLLQYKLIDKQHPSMESGLNYVSWTKLVMGWTLPFPDKCTRNCSISISQLWQPSVHSALRQIHQTSSTEKINGISERILSLVPSPS